MSKDMVVVERPADGVGLIRINRPEARNALSMAVRVLIAEHLNALDADDATRCIVLAGNQKTFASGGDIKESSTLGTIEKMSSDARKRRLWRAFRDCPKPLVAAVNGFALGAGCELAMMCDIIIAGESAKFGQPAVKIGVVAGGGGTQRLTRSAGKYRAMRYLLTGDTFTSRQALEMGAVSEVVPDSEVEKYAIDIASRIAELPPLAVQETKEVVLRGMDATLEVGIALEARASQILFSSQDQKEGMAAFLEKRKPKFQGK